MTSTPFLDEFVTSLRSVHPRAGPGETPDQERIREGATAISALQSIDSGTLAQALEARRGCDRIILRIFGLAVGLSHERLTSELRAHLTDDQRRDPSAVVAFLDREYDLVREVTRARHRSFSWTDVLIARAGSRGNAGRAIAGGRRIEDLIEGVVSELGLPCQLRTRFVGRGESAPCDIAIPAGGAGARIVCAAKGFDSTGSKLTDAVREIEQMANVRLPTQFVLAVVDGIGWLRRGSDLARIVALREEGRIDGLYSIEQIDSFRADVARFAALIGLAPREAPDSPG